MSLDELEDYAALERDITGQVLTHGRAWSIGVGGAGGKQAVRTTRQARAYQVSGEVVLTSIFELDIQQLRTVLKGVPPEIHVIHPEIKELKNFPLPEGGKQMHHEKMWAARQHWKPIVDGVIDRSLYVLQYREISPSIALIHWSPGGHAILAPYIAHRLREALPDTMRLGISIVPKDDESRKQFVELLKIMDPEEVTRA